jgi:hypothetical protein
VRQQQAWWLQDEANSTNAVLEAMAESFLAAQTGSCESAEPLCCDRVEGAVHFARK